jgi:hypothetical protein
LFTQYLGAAAAALLGASLVAIGMGLIPRSIDAATTEWVVADHHTGLAISGFDPVAYFTDSAATIGQPDLELRFAGATWRFRNEGNRAAFAADPDVYMPRFGGYDPTAVARGASAPGHPEIWIVSDDRLYLFHSAGAREGFGEDPERVIHEAKRRWPQVLRTLVP